MNILVWIGFLACLIFGAVNLIAGFSILTFNNAYGWDREGTIFAAVTFVLAILGFTLAWYGAPFIVVFS